jgi:TonB family protein
MEKAQKDEPIFQVVEEMPKFPGGLQEAMVFIGKNIKYPVAAQKARIEGRVIVQFVVGKDGSVSDIHTVRGVSPELDAEAIRVVSMMPKWIPGKQRGKAVAVKYTMPIMFRLKTPEPPKEENSRPIVMEVEDGASKESVDGMMNLVRPDSQKKDVPVVRISGTEDKLPLVVVDGEVKGNGTAHLSKVPVDQIESISVLKGETAMAEYGEQAKDGAIIIIMKKNKK